MSHAPAQLGALQRWMQEALLVPGAGAEALRYLSCSGRLGPAQGLAIYQRGFIRRLAACMRAQFPALCHALGGALFDDFAADYVRELPPESHTLYDLGRRFPDWLQASRPDADAPQAAEPWIDFMFDLARFERLVFSLFDAPGHEGRRLAGEDTPDIQLRLQPAFALGAYGFDVPRYYHSVRLGEEPPLPPRVACFVALVRTGYVTRTIPLSETDWLFLEAAAAGGLPAGFAALASRLGTDPAAVQRAWHAAPAGRRRMIALGFFASEA